MNPLRARDEHALSLRDEQRDQVYRDAIGWPVAREPDTPAAVVDGLKRFLAERRRVRALRVPKVPDAG